MSPPPEQILPNSDDSSSKDVISSGSESANSPLPATPEKRKSRWTKGGAAEEADDSTFSQDAPPPTSFTPPPGSDVVPRKILTPVHHFMAGSRRALWGDLANVTQPPRVYVDGRSIFREISSVTQLRRGDHCMTTLNMLRCLSPQVDYLVSLAGSLELLHCYHHFIMLDDVAVVDAYGVPRNKEGQIATIVEYSNTMPEFYEEVRVLSLNSWLHFPKHLIQQVCLGKAHCHRVPLADYGDMPHIFRIEERLSEEERERIVRDSERLLEDHPTYNMFWANCEHTTNMVSGAKKFTSPEVHFMFWSLFRYLLTLVGLAFLHFLTLRCYSRYCLQDFQWTLGAYYACTALPVLLQILVQFSRMAWNMVSCYLQNLISKDDLYHLLLKELCRAIFNGVLALGFLVWAPDFWHFKEGRLALSVAVVFAYYASDMVYALMAQVVTRLLMNNHGKYWLIGAKVTPITLSAVPSSDAKQVGAKSVAPKPSPFRSPHQQTMAEEEAPCWDNTLEEWCISEGHACAAALAQQEDGMFYAAAPQADEVGWGLLFKEEHEEIIMQEDMSEKPMQVNETTCLKNLVDKGACLQEGLWFGGEKYKVVQKDMAVEEGEHTLGWILATRSKKGVHIIVTNAQILVVNWDEEKGQTAGNCKKVALAFGAYLVGMGY